MLPSRHLLQKESPEARDARIAAEALAAKEAEAARVGLAAVHLREAAAAEEAAARVNARTLAATWLQRMRGAKLEALRSEASALAKQHDWECDRRDRRIEVRVAAAAAADERVVGVHAVRPPWRLAARGSSAGKTQICMHNISCCVASTSITRASFQGLLDDLGAADEAHAVAAQAHAKVTAQLLALHERRSGEMQATFLADLKAMQHAFERYERLPSHLLQHGVTEQQADEDGWSHCNTQRREISPDATVSVLRRLRSMFDGARS